MCERTVKLRYAKMAQFKDMCIEKYWGIQRGESFVLLYQRGKEEKNKLR